MIRPNCVALTDRPPQVILERRVVEQAGQTVGLGADLDRPVDLRVLQCDGHLGREQLDQVELLGRERVPGAEALDGQHADRARPTAQRDDDEAAVDRPPVVASRRHGSD